MLIGTEQAVEKKMPTVLRDVDKKDTSSWRPQTKSNV